jgi:hypothetical protein
MNVKIIDYSKKALQFEDYHKSGGTQLNYAGFECLNGVFKFSLDGVTDITGLPHSGKTEFALELLFYQTEAFGLRHLLYAPDIGSYNEIRRKLLVKHYRRSFRGYENSITQTEIIKATAWIDTYFLIAQKDDAKKPLTPIDLWNFGVDYEDNNGPINTVFIDSWKNLFHDLQQFGGREDLYLDYVLAYRNELAEAKCKHLMTIAHPKKMEIMMPKDGSKPKRRVPDADDIKGGSAWNSNGKTIITVDYPEKQKQTVDLYFNKVKPDVLGKANVLFEPLEFDWRKSRYRETIEGKICYAGMGKEYREKGEFIGFASQSNNDIKPIEQAPF